MQQPKQRGKYIPRTGRCYGCDSDLREGESHRTGVYCRLCWLYVQSWRWKWRRQFISLKPGDKCVDCGSGASGFDHRDLSKVRDVVPICAKCNGRRGPAKFPEDVAAKHREMNLNKEYVK